ncbi:hypothetical protein ACFHW1_22645, partial [Micromonospora sp. LOL_014]|uniref:hypothetical protein n=1 Tax=Micromonospora sp. LOL_014 TaxID=3345415 RepID=UPI003A8C2AC0
RRARPMVGRIRLGGTVVLTAALVRRRRRARPMVGRIRLGGTVVLTAGRTGVDPVAHGVARYRHRRT